MKVHLVWRVGFKGLRWLQVSGCAMLVREITSESLHNTCSFPAGEVFVALGLGVKQKHSQESMESLAKQ